MEDKKMDIKLYTNEEEFKLCGKTISLHFEGAKGESYSCEITFNRYLGSGASCFSYEVDVINNKNGIPKRMVFKQFYPKVDQYVNIKTLNENNELTIAGYPNEMDVQNKEMIDALGKKFEEAYVLQNKLYNDKELKKYVVTPNIHYFNGLTKYVLYETDDGNCLKIERETPIETIIQRTKGIAEALGKLHAKNYVYMDLKPENVLETYSGDIKLLDFDAIINLDMIQKLKKEDVRYSSNLDIIAPEIRPNFLRADNFDQEKRNYITQKVDVYALGAIFFHYFFNRDPEEINEKSEVERDSFEKNIRDIFETHYRKQLTNKQQELIIQILKQSLAHYVHERYVDANKMLKDLEQLQQSLQTNDSDRLNARLDGINQSAYVLSKYPLSRYCKKVDAKNVMDALLIGDDPIVFDFFSNLLLSAYMLDTTTVIRVMVPNAKDKFDEYKAKWELLDNCYETYLEDKPYGEYATKVMHNITDEPLAKIIFYELDPQKSVTEVKESMEDFDHISWIAINNTDSGKNLALADEYANVLNINRDPAFVAYLDERGDGFELRSIPNKYDKVETFAFSLDQAFNIEDEEKYFHQTLNKKALTLHKYYAREYDERGNDKEIRKTFRNKKYNVLSSIASVLSIPYKLASIGVEEDDCKGYLETVFNASDDAKQIQNNLIWLEHQRWIGFMVTQGYHRSSIEKVKEYAFKGNNDQRDQVNLYHLCLAKADKNGLKLDQITHDQWKNMSVKDLKKEKLDPLDQASVLFHQYCDNCIKNNEINNVYSRVIENVEQKLSNVSNPANEIFDLLDILKIYHKKMIDNEANINDLWNKTYNALFKKIENDGKYGEVKKALESWNKEMKIVKERNNYHDYKKSDISILKAIPLIMLEGKGIDKIHKLAGKDTWQNVMSTLLIEPKQLIIYTDEQEKVEEKLIQDFIKSHRGIATKVSIKPLEELKKVTNVKGNEIIDVTGCDEFEYFAAIQAKGFTNIPYVVFKDSGLINLNTKAKSGYKVNCYSNLERHITVDENFTLNHSVIDSNIEENHLLGLIDDYSKILDSYKRMDAPDYTSLCNFFDSIEKSKQWKIGKKLKNSIQYKTEQIPSRMIYDNYLDQLFEKMKDEKLIDVNLPLRDTFGIVEFKIYYENIKDYINKIFMLLQTEPYMHNFKFVKTKKDLNTGFVLDNEEYYIIDDTLISNGKFKYNSFKNFEFFKRAITSFDSQVINISRLEDGHVDQDGNKFVDIKFTYNNKPIRECLRKSGNLLEAIVYFTIWKHCKVDSLKVNVDFIWEADTMEDYFRSDQVRNEIDVIFTKNMETYFISCKMAEPEKEYLVEIKSHADNFGVNANAILIDYHKKSVSRDNGKNRGMVDRSKKMKNVYYIDKYLLKDDIENNLAKLLNNIIEDKSDWEKID